MTPGIWMIEKGNGNKELIEAVGCEIL